jgi:hypothetical protein
MLNKEKLDLRPLYLRLESVVQHQVQQRRQEEEGEVFQPAIDRRSAEIALSKKDRIANIVDRLLDDFKAREDRDCQLREKYNQVLDVTLPFKPTISTGMPIDPPSKVSSIASTADPYTYHPQINPLSALITQDR